MIATSDQSRSSTTISFADSDALVIHPHWQDEVQLQRSSCQQQQATWRIRRPDGRCSSSTTRFRHQLKSHQNFDSFDFPRSGENGNRLRRRKMGITFVVVRLFPQWLLLIELLLAPLNFVLAWTWLLKLVFTWGNIWKRNNVRCRIFIFGICSIPSCSNLVLRPRHWGWALFVFVFRACGRRCAVGNRSLHGGGTAQANRHGGGTVQTRDRRIIERPNRKGKSEFNNVPVTWLWLLRHALRSTRIPSEMRIRVMDENVTLWMKRPNLWKIKNR